jgi:hypothetical protein
VNVRVLRAAARHSHPLRPEAIRTAGVPSPAAAAAADLSQPPSLTNPTEPSENADHAAAARVRHPTLLQSLQFMPTPELLAKLKPAGHKRSRAIVQAAVSQWAAQAFEDVFRPRDTVRAMGWRLLRPRRQDIAKVPSPLFTNSTLAYG